MSESSQMPRREAAAASPYCTAVEVAALLGVHPRTARRWGATGALPRVVVGGTVRFRRADVEALLNDVAPAGNRREVPTSTAGLDPDDAILAG